MKNSSGIQINGSSFRDVNQFVGTAATTGGSDPRVRVLFLAACPSGTPELRLDREIKAIQEALRTSKNGAYFEVEQSWAADDKDLQDSLLRHTPDLVHLSAHGNQTGKILLEQDTITRDLDSRPCSAARENLWLEGLVRIFTAARGRIRCVILNSCYSEPVAWELAKVVGCVVGMSDAIEDAAAIRFSWSFYNALGHGMNLKSAFELAIGQVALASLRTSNVPRLVTAGIAPEEVTFG